MNCQGSKFLLVTILTFAVGIGIVQVWQPSTRLNNLETKPETGNLAKTTKSLEKKQNNCEEFENKTIKHRTTPKRIVSGGFLNSRAWCIADAVYPFSIIPMKASGKVEVQVLIDENGKVISAKAISGHHLLRKSAVEAAYKSKFSPTLLGGEIVKITGVLVYNYNLPN
jgi:TonB family protein